MESILDLAYNTLASESIENIKSNNIINCSDSSNESTLLEKNNCMWHKQINSVYYFESAASEMNQVIDSITYSNSITSPASENIGKNNKGFNIVDSGSKEKCSLIEMNEDKGFLDKKTFDILNCQENDMENQEYNNVTNMINNIVDSDEDTNSSISSCKENGSQELKDLSGAIRFSDKKTSGILHCQENDMENEEYNNVTNMINNIVDSDEDSNSSIASCKENGALELKDLSGVINKKKMGSVRASKESAMQQIHSETQRLIRESHITLPYHRPKQRTLQEFLNRKKTNSILPPNLTCAERVKMFPQIVGKVVSKIETEAENFYTSSDSDNESIEQKKVDFTDAKSTNECHNSDTQNLIHKVLEKENDLLNIENTQNYVAKENDDLMNTSNEDNNFDKSKEVSTTTIIEKNSLLNMNETDSNSNDSKYLTSKLDIENNDISALSNLPTSQKDDKLYDKMGKSIKNLNMKTEYLSSITQIPTIKGSPGSIINLMDPNPINEGAARLLNRFIRHSKIKKCNHNDILEVKTLRTEGAKNDIKVIEEILPFTKVIDEDDDQRESRPGEKLLKLKKDLKRKISIAKTEEWKQKEMNNKEEESTCNDDESYKNLPDEYDIESAESDESGLEENDVTMEDKVSKKCKFLNEEAEESDADDGEQSNEYEDEEQINNEDSDEYEETEEIETENETVQTAYKKQKNLKRIIIPADDDSNHSESSLNKTNEDTFNLQTNSNYINEIDDVDNISLFQPQGCNGLDSRNQICKTPLLTSNNVFSMISPVTHLTVLNTVTDSAKKLSFNSAECTPTDESISRNERRC